MKNRMSKKWTANNHLVALKEGWILTNNSDEQYIIAKVDDPPAWPEHEAGLLDYDQPKFEYDDDAEEFVRSRAAQGSETAQLALSLVGENIEYSSRCRKEL
jgi:hypothetical protein